MRSVLDGGGVMRGMMQQSTNVRNRSLAAIRTVSAANVGNGVERDHSHRYLVSMLRAYYEIEEAASARQFGTEGADGWGFHLWSELVFDEAPHRAVLEKFAAAYPQSGIALPAYELGEDFIECDAVWASQPVWVYYETVLSHLWLWSADRDAIEGLRSALIPLATI